MNPDFLILFFETYLERGFGFALVGLFAALFWKMVKRYKDEVNTNEKTSKAIEKISETQEKVAESIPTIIAKQDEHSDAISRFNKRLDKVESKLSKNEIRKDRL